MATSKPTTFLKDNGCDCISTGITGTSQNRQDFLVIGKERNGILGLLVLPCVISVNSNEELRVLANARYPPFHIPPRTPIAIAIALPMGTADHMPPRCFSVAHENPEVLWVQHISSQRPMITCELSVGRVQVKIQGMIDTGGDVIVISYYRWPTDWKLITPPGSMTGIGGVTPCL